MKPYLTFIVFILLISGCNQIVSIFQNSQNCTPQSNTFYQINIEGISLRDSFQIFNSDGADSTLLFASYINMDSSKIGKLMQYLSNNNQLEGKTIATMLYINHLLNNNDTIGFNNIIGFNRYYLLGNKTYQQTFRKNENVNIFESIDALTSNIKMINYNDAYDILKEVLNYKLPASEVMINSNINIHHKDLMKYNKDEFSKKLKAYQSN